MERLCHRVKSPHSCSTGENTNINTSSTSISPLSAKPAEAANVEPIGLAADPALVEECRCSICLTEYLDKDRVRILACRHEYHAECIDIWLTSKSTQCPLCKHDLLQDIVPSSTTSTTAIVL
ncbi:MAG: hypothetical protein J3Q66DRAFT_72399 [Benniella sp.]|nr:MAG: hypothetical protein J3Q66DRAFT_72399 [Benniella sp.]